MKWFEKKKKEMKGIRPIKNTWYNQLVNYILQSITKGVDGFKDKIVSRFKTNTPKETMFGKRKKLSKPRKQKIKMHFISEKNKEEN